MTEWGKNMQIYRLRNEEKSYFDWMDPYGFLSRLALPHYFALAACVKGEDGGDVPSGLLVASIEEERIIIEWMCVAPEIREQGVGDALLDKVFEIARENNFTQVGAGFIDDPDLKEAEEAASEYFRERGFWEDEDRPGEWNIAVDQLGINSYFKDDKQSIPEAKTLSEFSSGEVRNAIKTLGTSDKASRLFDPTIFNADYDLKLSSVLIADDEPCGLFLIVRADDICYPVFMYAESEREKKALILASAKAAQKELLPGSVICLIAADDETADLAGSVFPEEKTESLLMLANSV